MTVDVPRPVPRPIGVAHTPAYPEADLTNCDREPIHIPGAIQPHGVLLSLTADLREVVTASANCAELLGIPVTTVIGSSLGDLLGPSVAAAVASRSVEGSANEPLVVRLEVLPPEGGLAGRDVDVHVFRSGDRLVVELEPMDATGTTPLAYSSARAAMARLAGAGSIVALAGHLAHEVRALLGFDRVMVYRFDPQWNGEVIAEERRDDLNPFLGLHYPATDIPAQARRLYTVNWTRLIVDIGYTPVPLVPITDPGTGVPLDLSSSRLRSVSPIHVEYLGHMGVSASMSISLVVEDELWGLIACHHYSGPHRPAQDARAAAEFLGQVASQLIAEREHSDRREAALTARTMLAGITARIAASPDHPLAALIADPELLSLLGAQGAAVAYDDFFASVGDVPDEAGVRAVARALEDGENHATFTDQVPLLSPELGSDDLVRRAAGALRVGDSPDRWLLWIRPEQEQTVDWGGDPSNKRVAAAEGPEVRLSPRRSFAKWREVVTGRSLPWEPWQVEAADALSVYLTGVLLSRAREHVAVAEAVQRSVVIDEVPQFPGYDVAARYLPAATLQMGGDWWDAFEVSPGRVALVLGDVAGHGVHAASAMIQLRTAIRAYLHAGATGAGAIDLLDQLMIDLLDDQVATIVVATVELATGEVTIASAGHPWPMLTTPEGTRSVELPSRPLLGLGWESSTPTTFVLPPGSTLVLFSDGLVERRGVDLDARTSRLRGLASYAPTTDLDGWLDHVLTIRDGTEDDDTTLLAIRRAVS